MAVEWEVRLYDTAGNRQPVTDSMLCDFHFALSELGGCDTGELILWGCYEDDLWDGWDGPPAEGWRWEVWQQGTDLCLYRGIAHRVELGIHEESSAQVVRIQTVGLIEPADRLPVDAVFVHAGGTDVTDAFAWVADRGLRGSDRLDNPTRYGGDLVYDLTASVGYTVEKLDFQGSSARAAFDALADAAQGLLVWGFRVDSRGDNVLYVRPKPALTSGSTVLDNYWLTLGREILDLEQPRDLASIRNALTLYGGKAKAPNLVFNGDFALPTLPGESASSNFVANPGFEEGSGQETITGWSRFGSALRRPGGKDRSQGEYAHSGGWFGEVDGPGDALQQDVPVTVRPEGNTDFLFQFHHAVQLPTGSSGWLQVTLTALDAGGTTLQTLLDREIEVPSQGYSKFREVYTVTSPLCTTIRIRFAWSRPGNDIMLDDVILNRNDVAGQAGWKLHYYHGSPARGHADWTRDDDPYHGAYSVRVEVTGASDYRDFNQNYTRALNLMPEDDRWSPGRYNTAYELSVWVKTSAALKLALGIQWVDSKGDYQYDRPAAATLTAADGQWHRYSEVLVTGSNMMGQIRPIVFLCSPGAYELDCVMLRESGLTSETAWIDGDELVWRFRSDNAVPADYQLPVQPGTPDGLSAAAQASIATYGLRWEEVDAEEITDLERAKQYAVGYLNARAVLQEEGRVLIQPVEAPILYVTEDDTFGGALGIAGLKTTLKQYPARITYTMHGSGLSCELELVNRRTSVALLLKEALGGSGRRRRGGGGVSGFAAGPSNTAGPVLLRYGPAEASPYQRTWDAAGDRTGGTQTLTLCLPDGTAFLPRDGTVLLVFCEGSLWRYVTRSDETISFSAGYHPIENEVVTVLVTPGEYV